MKPSWEFFRETSISNFKNQKMYRLVSSKDLNPTNEQLESMVQACNSIEIFKWLFSEMCPNGYTKENAIGFLKWARQGWLDNSHFVFLILSDDDKIVGAIDIKSNNLEAGEIGYWVHQDHSGLASNAVAKIIEIAKLAGYKTLFAQTKKGNEKSNQVLIRNLFEVTEKYKDDSCCDNAFCITL